MSTVQLSQPARLYISAENAFGIASQPLTVGLPAAHAVFSLLGMEVPLLLATRPSLTLTTRDGDGQCTRTGGLQGMKAILVRSPDWRSRY